MVSWIEAGRRGETPMVTAARYTWKETPRLNADAVKAARSESMASFRRRLEKGYERVMATIDWLDDRQLLEAGIERP